MIWRVILFLLLLASNGGACIQASGDLTDLTTFRAGTGWTGSTWPASATPATGDNTYWFYDPAGGALLQKNVKASVLHNVILM